MPNIEINARIKADRPELLERLLNCIKKNEGNWYRMDPRFRWHWDYPEVIQEALKNSEWTIVTIKVRAKKQKVIDKILKMIRGHFDSENEESRYRGDVFEWKWHKKIKVRWRILKSNGDRCEVVTEEENIPMRGEGKWISGKKERIGTEVMIIVKGGISIEEDCLVIAKEMTNKAKEKSSDNSDEWINEMIAVIDIPDDIPEC